MADSKMTEPKTIACNPISGSTVGYPLRLKNGEVFIPTNPEHGAQYITLARKLVDAILKAIPEDAHMPQLLLRSPSRPVTNAAFELSYYAYLLNEAIKDHPLPKVATAKELLKIATAKEFEEFSDGVNALPDDHDE